MEHPKYLKGVFFCLIATLSWGAMFPVMTDALNKIDPFTFTALRYSIAGIAFIILLYVKEGVAALVVDRQEISLAWVFGSAGFAGFGFLVFYGQQLAGSTGALTASIMMATMPLQGLLVTWVFRGVRPPLFSFVFIGLSFFGVLLVISKGDFSALLQPQNYSANIPLILGALCWVLYTFGGSYYPTWSPYKYTAITTFLGLTTVYGVTALLLLVGHVPTPSKETLIFVIPHLLYMSLVAGFVGVLAWNMGNKILTPLNGVLFMDVVPVTSFIVSAMTGLIPTNVQLSGALCTATALILNNLFQRNRIKKQSVSTANKLVMDGAGITRNPSVKTVA